MKNFSEISLEAAKSFVSPQTGMVHYFYHGSPPYATIPLYENFCYLLALFKTRTQEGVQDAMKLLSKLLHFQNQEGAFPVYLHEYPEVHDLFLNAYLLPPLQQLMQEFKLVLPQELKTRLARAIESMQLQLKKNYTEKKPKGHIAFKISQALKEELPFTEDHPVSSQLLERAPREFWHAAAETYVGPCYREFQEGFEPECTLYNLIFGTLYPRRLNPHHIQASLLREKVSLAPLAYPYLKNGPGWAVFQEAAYAYSVLKKENPAPLFHQPGVHLFRLVIKGKDRVHTLVLPGGAIEAADYETSPSLLLHLTLGAHSEVDDREKAKEVVFYHDLGPLATLPSGRSSVFALGDTLTLHYDSVKVHLTFDLVEGSGDFAGHIGRANRPSQLLKEGVFDQTLFLRTLRRTPHAKIQVRLTIEEFSQGFQGP